MAAVMETRGKKYWNRIYNSVSFIFFWKEKKSLSGSWMAFNVRAKKSYFEVVQTLRYTRIATRKILNALFSMNTAGGGGWREKKSETESMIYFPPHIP